MAKNNVWMSVSDLMTGLMVIFLFIAIAYIIRVHKNQSILKDFVENKQELHDKLAEQFKNEEENGTLTIGGDLSMRFQKAESLFDDGDWHLKPEFKEQLASILPKYLEILLADTLKSKIREIRIEGHTNTKPCPRLDSDPYIANLILSQRRALSVMYFIKELPEYQLYSDSVRRQLDYWFTANGFSYGHALDKNNNYTFISGEEIDQEKSKRVEIRIITSGEEVLEHFIENNK